MTTMLTNGQLYQLLDLPTKIYFYKRYIQRLDVFELPILFFLFSETVKLITIDLD